MGNETSASTIDIEAALDASTLDLVLGTYDATYLGSVAVSKATGNEVCDEAVSRAAVSSELFTLTHKPKHAFANTLVFVGLPYFVEWCLDVGVLNSLLPDHDFSFARRLQAATDKPPTVQLNVTPRSVKLVGVQDHQPMRQTLIKHVTFISMDTGNSKLAYITQDPESKETLCHAFIVHSKVAWCSDQKPSCSFTFVAHPLYVSLCPFRGHGCTQLCLLPFGT